MLIMTPMRTKVTVMASAMFRMRQMLPWAMLLKTSRFTVRTPKTTLTTIVLFTRQLMCRLSMATGATNVPCSMPWLTIIGCGTLVLTVACMQLWLSLLITEACMMWASDFDIGMVRVSVGRETPPS